jgi:hypothetical protein
MKRGLNEQLKAKPGPRGAEAVRTKAARQWPSHQTASPGPASDANNTKRAPVGDFSHGTRIRRVARASCEHRVIVFPFRATGPFLG